ncbi:MAG: PilZ domain-containing protein [Bdellovibrionota bacterium]
MREKRRFPRYDVSNLSQFSAKTKQGPIGETLVNVSEGGCGFWAPAEDFRSSQGQQVEIELNAKGVIPEPLLLHGAVAYVIPYPYEGQLGFMYGIKFYDESCQKVLGLIEYLKELHNDGKARMAK